jgi:hypothetical protein
MKCLSRIEMQEYIDNEAISGTKNEIAKHIENCELCSSLYKEANGDKALINRLLDVMVNENESITIPEFKTSIIEKSSPGFIRYSFVLAAAALIGFIFLFRIDRKPVTEKIPAAEILMYEFYDGKDLNRLWHDKSQIIIIQDEKGNVIQSIITN